MKGSIGYWLGELKQPETRREIYYGRFEDIFDTVTKDRI